MLTWCQFDPWEQTSMKFYFKHFHSSKNCIWKCQCKMLGILFTCQRFICWPLHCPSVCSGPLGCWHRVSSEIPGYGQHHDCTLRGRGSQSGTDLRGLQHRQTLGPALHLCVWKQWLRYGDLGGQSSGFYGLLHTGGLHPWYLGKWLLIIGSVTLVAVSGITILVPYL